MSTLDTTTGSDSAALDDGKRADLSGPGIGTYDEVAAVLPTDYRPRLGLRETQEEIFVVKRLDRGRLYRRAGPGHGPGPADRGPATPGSTTCLDRDGSRTPICVPHQRRQGPFNPIRGRRSSKRRRSGSGWR